MMSGSFVRATDSGDGACGAVDCGQAISGVSSSRGRNRSDRSLEFIWGVAYWRLTHTVNRTIGRYSESNNHAVDLVLFGARQNKNGIGAGDWLNATLSGIRSILLMPL